MTARIRTLLTAARARSTARHLAAVRFCDGCARISDGAGRAAEHRRRIRSIALTHAR